jgi:hypothetical protein
LPGVNPKPVLIRGIGPKLLGFGVSDAIADPRITLFRGGEVIATNEDWGASPLPTDIKNAAAKLGAFALDTGSKDAALLTALEPGIYTVQLDRLGSDGSGLIEVYDAVDGPGTDTVRLANISTRGWVSGEDNRMISGFVVSGNRPKRVLVRAAGPSLEPFGLSGFLPDPVVTVLEGAREIARNNDWEQGGATASAEFAARVGAFAFPSGSKDAAIVLTLPPGIYTAHVTGNKGSTGVALVEVYEVD